MSAPAVIAVAITGSVPRKKDNPALPVTVPEQVESTQAAFEAGATLVHVHVRNADESSSSDPDKFAAFQEGVRRHCPGMIVQFSTGGRGRELAARGARLVHKPDTRTRPPSCATWRPPCATSASSRRSRSSTWRC